MKVQLVCNAKHLGLRMTRVLNRYQSTLRVKHIDRNSFQNSLRAPSRSEVQEAEKKVYQHSFGFSDRLLNSVHFKTCCSTAQDNRPWLELHRSSFSTEDLSSSGCIFLDSGELMMMGLELNLSQEPASAREESHTLCTPSTLMSGADSSHKTPQSFDGAILQSTWSLVNQWIKMSSGSEQWFQDNNDKLTNRQNDCHDSLIIGSDSVSSEDRIKECKIWQRQARFSDIRKACLTPQTPIILGSSRSQNSL